MTIVVNLNSFFHLRNASQVKESFVKLCDEFPSRYRCPCPNFLSSSYNQAWVEAKYLRHGVVPGTLIPSYKSSHSSSLDFLRGLGNIFDFITEEGLKRSNHFLHDKKSSPSVFYSTSPGVDYQAEDIEPRIQLMEHAWNSMIDVTDKDVSTFRSILESGEDVTIYSHANELHVLSALNQLMAKCPEFKLSLNPFERTSEEDGVMTLGKGVKLVASCYVKHDEIPMNTPKLLAFAARKHLMNPNESTLISSFDGDAANLSWKDYKKPSENQTKLKLK